MEGRKERERKKERKKNERRKNEGRREGRREGRGMKEKDWRKKRGRMNDVYIYIYIIYI